MKCKVHKTYKAIRKPRVACEDCWRMWIYAHPAAYNKFLNEVFGK